MAAPLTSLVMAAQKRGGATSTGTRRRDQRLAVRTALEERELINKTARTTETDLTTFAMTDGTWWFGHREILIDLVGDLSHHLHVDH